MRFRQKLTVLGAVSPIGCNPLLLYDNIIKGVTNFQKPKNFKNTYNEYQLVSLISDDWYNECENRNISSEKHITNYIMLGVTQALEEAKLLNNKDLLKNACLYVGSSKNYLFNDRDFIADNCREIDKKGSFLFYRWLLVVRGFF